MSKSIRNVKKGYWWDEAERGVMKGDTHPFSGDSNHSFSVAQDKTWNLFLILLFLSHSSSNPSAKPVESPSLISRIWALLTISTATIQFEPTLSLPWMKSIASQLLLLLYLCPSSVSSTSVTTEGLSKCKPVRSFLCPKPYNNFPIGLCPRVRVLTGAYKTISESPP